MNIHERAIRDAVEAIADKVMSRQHDDSTVTVNDAVTQVDHDLMVAWSTIQTGRQSALGILTEALEGLTEAEAFSILTCAVNETDTVRKLIAYEVRRHVAKDLAYQAQQMVDRQPSSDGGVWDDPVRDDLRALARQSTAAYRTGREHHFDV